ncbi:hypothetical protein [Salmonella enterica]|uniref:hypothetical protein n=1 Tax=Salmonella enterica TaxID=28901 RepID=UPI0009B1161A|nr:hypothetical protein [Salmonella enterica]EAO7073540.1 hypothetical protein [Salmonella enterica]
MKEYGINDLIEAAEQANKLAQEAVEKLVQERNALAAENARLSDIAKGGAFVMQKALMKYEFGVGMTMQAEDFIRDARSKTPATDAFLAEVRAQGVEMAITHIEQTISPNHETVLNEYAAKIRKGVQS